MVGAALLVALAAPAGAQGEDDACGALRGPFRYTSQGPFQGLRHAASPYVPGGLQRGAVELHSETAFSNVFARDNTEGTYLLDYEVGRLAAGFRMGLGGRWHFGVEADAVRRYGGQLDGLVRATHELFGASEGGRQLLDDGGVQLRIDGAPFERLSFEAGGDVGRGVSVGVGQSSGCVAPQARGWTSSGGWYAALRSKSVEEVEGARWAGDELDVLLSGQWAWARERWAVYVGIGWTYFGDEELVGVALDSSVLTAGWTVEWTVSRRAHLLLQYMATEASLRDRFPFDQPTHEVLLGLGAEVLSGRLEIGLIENLFVSPNGPDIGFHVGYRRLF